MNLRSKVLMSMGVLAGVGALAGAGTFASFTAQTTNPSNTFADGTLVLSDKVNTGTACLSTGAGTSTDTNVNAACGAAFTLTVKKPGDSSTSNITLKNEGSIDGSTLKAFSPSCTNADVSAETYHGTGLPCAAIQLYVQQYSDSAFTTASACLYGGASGVTCDFSDTTKTLATYATAYPTSASGLSVGALSAGSSTYVKIGVKLPSTADNTYQGRQASMDLSWHLAQ